MEKGYLSQYFDGVAVKRLTAVEVGDANSNQHEFQGTSELRSLFGRPSEKIQFSARFLFFSESNDYPEIEDGFVTWSDVRRGNPNRSPEFHLYYSSKILSEIANSNDILLIGKRPNNTILIIIAESESTIARQILWLFGFPDLGRPSFKVRINLNQASDRIRFASRLVLENIGIPVEETEESHLDEMLKRFEGIFPSTKKFSAFARSTLAPTTPLDDPDSVLMAWMNREEVLFRTLEKHIISERLSLGFNDDVDGFISFSLSVQNRRKSRVGLAFENHLESLFQELGIQYSRNVITENRSKPDFIFPSKNAYHNEEFDPLSLTMLGVKSSCKDRWRQVLAEANRIERKHLLTLEAAISKSQTDEMDSKNLQLVIPRELQATYLENQQQWLMDVEEFTKLVLDRQKKTIGG